MPLKCVTCTGADDATRLDELLDVARRQPLIEWAILFSTERRGEPRYPSARWLDTFIEVNADAKIATSIHLCGSSVEAFVRGEAWLQMITGRFDRVQLNWDQTKRPIDLAKLNEQIERRGRPVITQHNAANAMVSGAILSAHHHVLFDASGGRGIPLSQIPEPLPGKALCGYAGGFNPANIPTFVPDLAAIATTHDLWIDLETGLRDRSYQFDLTKVDLFMARLRERWPAPAVA